MAMQSLERLEAHPDGEGQTSLHILREDRERLIGLLEEFDRADGSEDERRRLAERIFVQSDIHARLEEEILYPIVRPLTDREGRDQIYDAVAEHRIMNTLVHELRRIALSDPRFLPRFSVFRDTLLRHLNEEGDGVLADAEFVLEDELESVAEHLQERRNELDPERLRQTGWGEPGEFRDRVACLITPLVREPELETEQTHHAASA